MIQWKMKCDCGNESLLRVIGSATREDAKFNARTEDYPYRLIIICKKCDAEQSLLLNGE